MNAIDDAGLVGVIGAACCIIGATAKNDFLGYLGAAGAFMFGVSGMWMRYQSL